ncbi:lantibiotic dehydratase [Mycolicibacterium thermoresistibile]
MTDRSQQNTGSDRSLRDAAIIRCSLGTVADYADDPAEWGDIDAIARLWSAGGIREAVLLASPVLATQVDKLLLSDAPDETPLRKRKRLHKGLLKYALRMSTRCTPFGMFAGVAVLPVGDEEPVLGKCHTRHVRATGAVTRRLLAEARAMPQARLYPNPALIERADRLVVTVMRGVDETHTLASVRATSPHGAVYRNVPGARIVFPEWNTDTPLSPTSPVTPPRPESSSHRGLAMPRRRRTREADEASRIKAEREANRIANLAAEAKLAEVLGPRSGAALTRAPLPPAEPDDPPPF